MEKVIAPSVGDIATILAKELKVANIRTVKNVSAEMLDTISDEKKYLIYIQFSENGNPAFMSDSAIYKIASVFVLQNKTFGNDQITARKFWVNNAVVIEVKIDCSKKMFKDFFSLS